MNLQGSIDVLYRTEREDKIVHLVLNDRIVINVRGYIKSGVVEIITNDAVSIRIGNKLEKFEANSEGQIFIDILNVRKAWEA